MTGVTFVPETGTKQDDVAKRKLIRRHVMLGKNQGRTLHASHHPAISAASIVTGEHWRLSDRPFSSAVPRRVGTDFSFIQFADEVDISLMSDTLQFCSTSSRNLFLLEPCISFDPKVTIHTCLQALTADALHLNIMVFSARGYIDSAQPPSEMKVHMKSSRESAKHYGKALRLLRERVIEIECHPSLISDTTLMALPPLAMHALICGDFENARNHVRGLSRLVHMRQDDHDAGVDSFKSRTKHLIEFLRCDLSSSLATGHAPLFFTASSNITTFSLPTFGPREQADERIPGIDPHLAEIWCALRGFCSEINKAAHEHRKLPEYTFLETMASVMYRLLHLSTPAESNDETIRLAMLAFCAKIFLSWRQLRIPFTWLQDQFKQSIASLMHSQTSSIDEGLTLWLLMVYGVAFSPLAGPEHQSILAWLSEVRRSCGCNDWKSTKDILRSFLWVDIVYDSPALLCYEKAS